MNLRSNTIRIFDRILSPSGTVHAHCDGPCGVYDPASARVAAEAVQSLTKKMVDMADPGNDPAAQRAHNNTFGRFVSIKEEQAELAKRELAILWTDYFKPPHLEQLPDLHDTFWKALKLCSQCKQEVNPEACGQLMDAIENIHNMFWKSKGREVAWVRAS